MSIQIGDAIPSATLHEGNPGTKVDSAEVFGSGKVLVFGVPGAFTPGCSNTHLPGYINDIDKIKGKGVDQVVCVSVNDAFVMNAWGEAQGAEGKVRMLADPQAELAKALGLDVEAAALGGTRSKRFAMLVENGTVTQLEVEPDGFGLSCSLAESFVDKL